MTVSAEQLALAVERCKASRVAAGLSPMIDDERTLRLIAAVMASSQERRDLGAASGHPAREEGTAA